MQNIVNALGAGSGVDTQALVSSLVEVEKAAPQERIDNKREKVETQISDYGLLSNALSVLQDAADALGNSDTFNSKSAAFTDSTALTPIALEAEASAGDYSFTINQLAQAQSLSSDVLLTDPSDAVGKGVITFDFGAWDLVTPPANPSTFSTNAALAPQTITIDDSNNSLSGLATAINEADFGVQASIINDGTGYRLVMRAESGENNQLRIRVAEEGGSPTNTDNSDLSRFAFHSGAFQMNQNQVGQDAELTVNGLAVSRATNLIDDVIDGFEFRLSEVTQSGDSINVTIEEDKATAQQSVRDFVSAYNTFLETLAPLIAYNEETESYGSLANDSLAKGVPTQIRQLLVGEVQGLAGDFSSLTNVGIRTELDGSLAINESEFTQALNSRYDQFKALFIPVTSSSTDQIRINSTGNNTTAGEYDIVISQPPTKGALTGADMSDTLVADLLSSTYTSASLTGNNTTAALSDFVATSGSFSAGAATLPLDLATQGAGSNDYDFNITVDGVSSAASISLAVADYASYDDMAAALQTAINNDANIAGVSVSYDTDHFIFSSSTTGVGSTVSLTAVGASANDLGVATGTSQAGTGGANDYDFSIEVDGTTSGTISITPGNYASFDDLASHLTGQINADATLSGAGASVNVTHNGSAFVITSNSSGASSTLAQATAIGPNAADLGITAGSVSQGSDSGGDTSAYDFSVTVNGTTSGTISLQPGPHADKNALAAHLQQQINADSNLIAAGSAVSVSYDASNDRFELLSNQYGATSNVSVTDIGGSASEMGLSVGSATIGVNVAGTIDGVEGFGSGNVLLPALGQPGESMGLIIGENATSATVNFSRGFGGQLGRLIDSFLSNSGVIQLREDSLNNNLEAFDEDQARLDRRIEAYQERLTSQFIAMEAIVRSLQDSGSFLESTLESLLDSYSQQ